jgi:hypothetical protein
VARKKSLHLHSGAALAESAINGVLWFNILYGTFSPLFVWLLGMARRLIRLDLEEQAVSDQVAGRSIGPHE